MQELEERVQFLEAANKQHKKEPRGTAAATPVLLRSFNTRISICKNWSLGDFRDMFNSSSITSSELATTLVKKTFFTAQDAGGHNVRKLAEYTTTIEIYTKGSWQPRTPDEVVQLILPAWQAAQQAAAAQLINRGLISITTLRNYCRRASWMSSPDDIVKYIEEEGLSMDAPYMAEAMRSKADSGNVAQARSTALTNAITSLTKQVKKNHGVGFGNTPAKPWPSDDQAAVAGKFTTWLIKTGT